MIDGTIFLWLLIIPIGFLVIAGLMTLTDAKPTMSVEEVNAIWANSRKKEWAEVKGKNGSTTHIYQYAESKGIVGKITLQDDGLWRAEVDLSRRDFVSLSDAKQSVEQVTK